MNRQEIEKAIKLFGDRIDIFERMLEFLDDDFEKNEGKEEISALNTAISALQQQLNNGWIPVSERLPVSEERVLICADRKFQDGNTIQIIAVAMYEDGTMYTNESGFMWEDDIDFEYDEEADDFIIPEGWWEQSMYCEEFSKVDDFVTHWMPLPEPYKDI